MGYKLYTSKSCGYCADARQYLRERGISFTEISTDNPSGSKEADRLGIKYMPTLVKNGRICEEIKACVR